MAEKDDPKRDAGSAGGADSGAGAATKVAPKRRPRSQPKQETQQLPPYNVVLLDDDDHTYDYVIEMLGKVFAHPVERAMQMAKEVDSSGRVIVLTTHKERAELYQEQFQSKGLTVTIEPAEE